MNAIDLGKIMITPEGTWSPNRSYERLSAVSWNGNGYIAIKDSTAVEPGTDDSVWMMFVQAGDSPEFSADEQGNIFKNGELLTSVLADAAASVHPPTISQNIVADKNNTTKTVSPKAVYDFIFDTILSRI